MGQIPLKREIWIAKVPFSNSAGFKIRPVLILSSNDYNENNPDVVGAAITTYVGREYTIPLGSTDFEKEMLAEESAVRYDGLIKIDKSMLHKRVAKVNEAFRKKIVEKIISFIE